jgi:hypothetical protein
VGFHRSSTSHEGVVPADCKVSTELSTVSTAVNTIND